MRTSDLHGPAAAPGSGRPSGAVAGQYRTQRGGTLAPSRAARLVILSALPALLVSRRVAAQAPDTAAGSRPVTAVGGQTDESSSPEAPAAEPGSPPVPPPPPPRHAASGSGQGRTAPSIALETPALTAQPLRTYRTHDGFYLRLSLGFGTLAVDVDPTDNSLDSTSASSGAVAFDALIGGTPTRGLAIGGALLLQAATSNALDVGGNATEEKTTLTTGIVGAFVDGFPDPHGGFHVGGAVGLASAALDPETSTAFHGGGVGFSGWLGYGVWVSPEWSVGGVLRVYGAVTRDGSGDGFAGRSSGLMLSASALFH